MNAEEKKAWEEMVGMANKVRPRNKHQDKMRKAILFAGAVIERAGDVEGLAKAIWNVLPSRNSTTYPSMDECKIYARAVLRFILEGK